ncbi:MAG: hypothetical protein R3D63_14830 [Paracoccaceae bacterium]
MERLSILAAASVSLFLAITLSYAHAPEPPVRLASPAHQPIGQPSRL